uniref:Uncharacterized protein n=1 Tax=Panagrolaimus davidi TaxID=227884 RepID=A0A914QJ19_9BILA
MLAVCGTDGEICVVETIVGDSRVVSVATLVIFASVVSEVVVEEDLCNVVEVLVTGTEVVVEVVNGISLLEALEVFVDVDGV